MKLRAGTQEQQARQVRAAVFKHGYATLIRDGDYSLHVIPGPAEVLGTYESGVKLADIIEDVEAR